MNTITYRGKIYRSIFEMPDAVRKAYQKEKQQSSGKKITSPLTDFVEMSDEVREIYERALGNVEKKSLSSRPLEDLPKTEDIFRQSAQARKPQYPSGPPAIEADDGLRRLGVTVIVVILLAGAVFLAMQYL